MGKMDKSLVPKLTAPLSELTKNLQHIPMDIEAWCNRPIEQRKLANRIKISRPLNNFMLYKKAYRERCMAWCGVNDNRVLSNISGQSWALEPREIKQLYTHYAEVERKNHLEAHPDYKFSPKRVKRTSRKRKGALLGTRKRTSPPSPSQQFAPHPLFPSPSHPPLFHNSPPPLPPPPFFPFPHPSSIPFYPPPPPPPFSSQSTDLNSWWGGWSEKVLSEVD